MSDLEYRMRLAKKIIDVLLAEAPGAQFDGFEGVHILGIAFGLGLAAAPTQEARKVALAAHQRGVEQALELRAALDSMGVRPEADPS